MNTITLRLIVFLFLPGPLLFAQEEGFKIPDSLKNKSYREIYQDFEKVLNDTTKSLIYLNTYLEKGKRENNKIEMARAYSLLSFYDTSDTERIQYLDSSIALSKDSNDKFYPAVAYSFKGGFYFNKWRHEEALNNYLLAMEHAKKTGNEEYVYITKHNIALIKDKLGKYDEALEIFKKCLVYEERKGLRNYYNIINYLI